MPTIFFLSPSGHYLLLSQHRNPTETLPKHHASPIISPPKDYRTIAVPLPMDCRWITERQTYASALGLAATTNALLSLFAYSSQAI